MPALKINTAAVLRYSAECFRKIHLACVLMSSHVVVLPKGAPWLALIGSEWNMKARFLRKHRCVYRDHTIRLNLYRAIKEDVPQSRFAELMEAKPLNRVPIKKMDLPNTLSKEANLYQYSNEISLQENVNLFTNNYSLTNDQIRNVRQVTKKPQSQCKEWFDYKKRNDYCI